MAPALPAERPVVALLLAAGASRRFGGANKLLSEIGGETLVRRAARAILASRASRLVVVTGHEAERIEAALAGLDVATAHASDYASGMAASLRRGVSALPADVAGAAVCLADLPGLSTALIDRLIAAFEAADGEMIVFPQAADGRQGHPVIWPRACFGALADLGGDRGGKALLNANKKRLRPVTVGDESAFADIDTPDDLARFSRST